MFLKKIYKSYLRKFRPLEYLKKCGARVQDDLRIYGKVNWGTEPWILTIGSNVHITDGVRLITHDGGTLVFRHMVPDLEITKPITIGNNVYLGNNVIILPGVHIGNNVVIGAGAVVSRDIPDNSLAVGVPARVIKTCDEYFEKLQRESLHLGHLRGVVKDKALMRHFGYDENLKGIYW